MTQRQQQQPHLMPLANAWLVGDVLVYCMSDGYIIFFFIVQLVKKIKKNKKN
jgi:hypothetical protein